MFPNHRYLQPHDAATVFTAASSSGYDQFDLASVEIRIQSETTNFITHSGEEEKLSLRFSEWKSLKIWK
jgi:hypothetical protein